MGEEAKKGIGKVKIGLVISVIVMLILATSNIWFYLNKQSLESTYNDYRWTHSHTDSEYDTLNTEYNELQHIVNLQKSQIITDKKIVLQEHGERTFVASFTAHYAGYLTISLTSTTSNAYVDTQFSFHADNFKFTEVLGTSGSAKVCVLPTTIYIYIGNSNWFDPATHSISVTYWY